MSRIKHLSLTLALTIWSLLSVWAQSITFDFAAGYNAPIGGVLREKSVVIVEDQYGRFQTNYAETKSVSYGQGANVSANISWFSKKRIGMGLKMNALFSTPFHYEYKFFGYLETIENESYTEKAFSFQFIPHLAFRHDFKWISPVLEAGLLVGINTINTSVEVSNNYNAGMVVVATNVKDYGGAMLGFYSSVGMMFHVSKYVKLSLSMHASVGSYSPTKWKRTSFEYVGQDYLDQLYLADREGEYDNVIDAASLPINPNVPSYGLSYSMPFSNIGFNAGLCVLLYTRKIVKDGRVVPPKPTIKK
jgi:hypothetical protein